jgi:hypothetical protein
VTAPGQVISIQVSHHPGWHTAVPLQKDSRGMMWLRPTTAGETTFDLHYDGGWELRLCGWLGLCAAVTAGFLLFRGARR